MQPGAGRARTRRRSPATGSTEVVEVVPTVATTTAASRRASSASTRMPELVVDGHLAQLACRASARALSTDECACSEHDDQVAARSRRARRSSPPASRSTRCPRCARASRPAARAAARSSRARRPSSSVEAGAVRHRNATELSVAASSSARIAGSRGGVREVGEEARVLPVRDARQQHLVEVAQDGGERLGLLGRRRRQPRADLARARPGRAPAARRRVRGSARPTRAPPGRPRGSRRRSRRPSSAASCTRAAASAASEAARHSAIRSVPFAAATIARSISPARSEARTSSSRARARSTAAWQGG